MVFLWFPMFFQGFSQVFWNQGILDGSGGTAGPGGRSKLSSRRAPGAMAAMVNGWFFFG